MDSKTLAQVIHQVVQKYPEFNGVMPKIRQLQSVNGEEKRFTLTFHLNVLSSNQKRIPKYVRATVSEKGKILRLSSSR